jgi:hypothetical protein
MLGLGNGLIAVAFFNLLIKFWLLIWVTTSITESKIA